MDIFRNFRRKLSEHTAEIIAAGSVAAIVAIGTPCIASYLTPPAYAADSSQTLTEDKYVNGNFTVNGDLDLNGHSLTVTGDLIHNWGTITANGDISIGGNYITENSDDSSNFKTLRFASSDSQTRRSLYIGGDLRAYSLHIATDNQGYSGYDQISVGGSFYGSEASYDSSNYGSSDVADSKVVLVDNYNTPNIIFQFNGDRIHSISGNTGNVVVDSCQGRLKIGSGNIALGAGCDITLAPGSKFHGGTIFKGKTISAESGIELDGSLCMQSDSSLYVKGDLTAKNDATIFSEGYAENENNGNININATGNIIFIDGRLGNRYGSDSSRSTFNLTAGGDISFSTDSLSSAVNQMNIGGGLYVTNSSGSSEISIPKLYFTGNSEHELTMCNNGSSGNDGSSYSGEYSSSYLRINEFYPSGTVNFTRGTTVNIDRCAKLTISGSEFNGYINANSLTTTGDLTLNGTVYIADGTFTVNGNLTQSDSNSTIHLSGKSTLKTTGDYNFDSGSIFADSESQISVGGSFNVSSSAKFGSSSSDNYNDSYSSNYPIKIGGDLTVASNSSSTSEYKESTSSYNLPSLYFTGAEEHNISYPAGTAFSGADVRITELKSDGPVNVARGITTNIERCTKLTLSGGEFNGAITAETLTTTGDLTLNGTVYIADGTFTVNGNLTQSDSNSTIHLSGKSTLKTTGDYNFDSGSIFADSESQIAVGGSFNVSSSAKFGSSSSDNYNDSYSSNYPIKIGGDLTVASDSSSTSEYKESTSSYNLPSLYFTGAEEHNISYPAGTAFSGADVRITELKSDGPVNVARGITTNIERCTKLTLSGGEFNGAITAETLTTTGDLTLNGTVYIADGAFTVNGNLTQSGESSSISVEGENAKIIVNGDLNSANISGRGALYLNGEYGQTISGTIDLTTLVLSQKPDMYRIVDDTTLNVEKYKFRKIDPSADVTFKLGIIMYQGSEWSEITNNTVDISELGSKIPEARYAKAGPFDLSDRMTTTTNYTSESGAGTYYADVTLDSADITVRVPFIVTDRESEHPDPSACEHIYSITTALPTCTTNGSVVKTCVKCGDEVTSTIPATGHNWGEWVQFNSNTMTRTCSVCEKTEVKNTSSGTPGHTHNFTAEVKPATCTTAGYTTYTCECGEHYIDNIIDPAHKFGKDVIINQNITVRICSVCGSTELTQELPEHVHSFKNNVKTVNGTLYKWFECSCGEKTDTYVIITNS